MAVRIRLTRTGRKNLPSYRIAVFEGRTRRDGPALKTIGWFNPLNREEGKGFRVDADALKDWVSRGATVTLAVRQLLRRQGVELPVPVKTAKGAAAGKKKAGKKRATKRAVTKDKVRMVRVKKKQAKKVGRKALQAKKFTAKAAAKAAARKKG